MAEPVRCARCGAVLEKDDIALTRKMVNRGAETFFCVSCLAGHFEPEIDKADRTIPGKAIIYEALGKTMILGDTKANRELFKADDKHIFVPRGNFQRIVEAVINREVNL